MARFNANEVENYGGNGGGGYFSLKNHKDTAPFSLRNCLFRFTILTRIRLRFGSGERSFSQKLVACVQDLQILPLYPIFSRLRETENRVTKQLHMKSMKLSKIIAH